MQAQVYQPTDKNIRFLAKELENGELVAIPTETVYGLAANALDAKACRVIFKAKRRPANDPLIVHVLDLKRAEALAYFTPLARKLTKHFWPGPLTIILLKKACVPNVVTSGGKTVALRAPAHKVARKLLRRTGIPLAAPSANTFGYISPTEASHVIENLGRRIKYVLDGGSCNIGIESTILDLSSQSTPCILRLGAITANQLKKVIGLDVASLQKHGTGKRTRQLAPGMLSKHYSPRTPMGFFKAASGFNKKSSSVATIYLRKPITKKEREDSYWFSKSGSLSEIARNLYRVLRKADEGGHSRILVERIPYHNNELAAAINDRLTRATAKK